MRQAERCLWCGGPLIAGRSFLQLMTGKDELCGKCRSLLTPYGKTVVIEGLHVYALYVYDENFMKFLVQYKECMDEALKDVFLSPYLYPVKRRTAGKTLVVMPSSVQKRELRGFDTLKQLYGQLNCPFADLLEKGKNFQQSGNAEQRKKNAETIRLKDNITLPEGKMILVDDVVTTGSTLLAASKLLGVNEAVVLAVNRRLTERKVSD